MLMCTKSNHFFLHTVISNCKSHPEMFLWKGVVSRSFDETVPKGSIIWYSYIIITLMFQNKPPLISYCVIMTACLNISLSFVKSQNSYVNSPYFHKSHFSSIREKTNSLNSFYQIFPFLKSFKSHAYINFTLRISPSYCYCRTSLSLILRMVFW